MINIKKKCCMEKKIPIEVSRWRKVDCRFQLYLKLHFSTQLYVPNFFSKLSKLQSIANTSITFFFPRVKRWERYAAPLLEPRASRTLVEFGALKTFFPARHEVVSGRVNTKCQDAIIDIEESQGAPSFAVPRILSRKDLDTRWIWNSLSFEHGRGE